MTAFQAPAVPASHSPTVLLCGGGTGGHVYPALAVADALRHGALAAANHGATVAQPSEAAPPAPAQPGGFARSASSRPTVIYVGSADGMEAGLVKAESNLPFRAISAAALRGRNPLHLARNAVTMGRGTSEAHALLRELRPAAILGTGGYVCVPLFLAARALGIPTAIYLPDVVPGLAVRLLARIATVVACNVEDSAKYLRFTMLDLRLGSSKSEDNRRFVVTGYPVRRELFEQDKAACRAAFGLEEGLPTLLVYGGSRGARSINQAIAVLLPALTAICQIIHVCGREGDESFLQVAAAQLPEAQRRRYQLYPYLFSGANNGSSLTRSMTQAFGAADVTVCRSGASTLAELPAAGLPAVLVPYPFVHQEENADYLVARGAAVKVDDGEMLGSGRPEDGPLFNHVQHLLLAPDERSQMAERSRALARPDAARRLAALLLALATSTRTER